MTFESVLSDVPGHAIKGAIRERDPRRQVELSGFAALANGTTFQVAVLDLSYDGCKIATAVALAPGTRLKVSITGLGGALAASVRWCRDGRAGLQFNADEVAKKAQVPRGETRLNITAALSLRRAGRASYGARMFDCAPTGCKVEFVERPKVDEVLWVKFDKMDAIEAKVRWVDGYYGGLEFIRPIYPAVFQMLLVRLRD